MEKNFHLMTCTEDEKLLFATHMLKEDANAWWNSTRTYLEMKHTQITWEIFKGAFFDNIREHVLGLEKKVYNEAVQIARVIEASQRDSFFAQNMGLKRPATETSGGGNTRPFCPYRTQSAVVPARNTTAPPPSQVAGQNPNVKCFNCQQLGHYAKTYTLPRKQPPQQGKVFAVTTEEAATSPDVVTGTILFLTILFIDLLCMSM
ncbi:hypothetical protein NE237_014511 [Protea cynaroides]|uniref:CCHC-type domain-containing protein n=1 Tax=Protea cynaroides TaxID=273540 RepID=A0A9Q0QQ26_9MAGN|nr:hypothetical protein NE237_014511 [Protea cynaroides]